VGCAYRDIDALPVELESELVETELVFAGLVA
jgi:hypothetical protein